MSLSSILHLTLELAQANVGDAIDARDSESSFRLSSSAAPERFFLIPLS